MTAPTLLRQILGSIPPLDHAAGALVRDRLASLTKPAGSLGRLEELAIALAEITGQPEPRLRDRAVVVMAADHGVTVRGVSAYPRDVTAQMLANFVSGGAAINVLARRVAARVVVVDIGVDAEPIAGVLCRKVARGTRDMASGPAMSRDEVERAIEVGIEIVRDEHARGLDLVATGDMGIGNTTAASAITAVLTGSAVRAVTGRGTGVSDLVLERKIAVIERAIAVNDPRPSDPLDVLAKVGGLEIAGLAGVILGGCALGMPVLLDGFASGAAALIAVAVEPAARSRLLAAHRSTEPGHARALSSLGLRPLLDLELRLGEGTGAALALPLLDAAVAVVREMATFESAGVSREGA